MPDVTLILRNGTVRSLATPGGVAQAIAIDRNGRIAAVGSDAEVGNLIAPGVRVIDLNGRTAIPGFIDCHLHAGGLGADLDTVALDPARVKTADDIVRLLLVRLNERPTASIVLGSGYNQNALPGGRHVTTRDLDRVSTDVPVRIVHSSRHAAVVNSKALDLLGITRETPNPLAGEIVRDADGEPNGVLLETASWNELEKLLPAPTPSERVEALRRANGYMLERGITTGCEAAATLDDIAACARASDLGALRVRMSCMIDWAGLLANESATPTPNDLQPIGAVWHRVNVGQAKLFADGAITTRTCWLREPFTDVPDTCGIAMHAPDELLDLIVRAHEAGWQIATHAIGDHAIEAVLDAYAEAQRRMTRARPDHRIEHCMLLDDDLIARMRRQKIWSVGQPEFIATLGDAYVTALGEARAERLSPYATLDRRGVAQAFSSDCPVTPGAPLDGLRAAIERRTPSGRILNVNERVDPETALYAYTAAPAFAIRAERDRGTLEAGKWADIAILSADPIATPIDERGRLKVVATLVGGACEFGVEELGLR